MKAKATSEKQIDSIRTLLPEKSGQISRQSRETKTILEGAPNLGLLQTQQQLWQRSQTEMKTWIQILTGRSTLLRGELEKLSNLNKIWSKTRDAAKRAKAPQIVLYEIDDLLRAIAAERPSLEAELKSVLDLQGRVVLEAALCEAALDQIVEAQQSGLRDITARDSIPIWIPARWTSLADAFPERLREVIPCLVGCRCFIICAILPWDCRFTWDCLWCWGSCSGQYVVACIVGKRAGKTYRPH